MGFTTYDFLLFFTVVFILYWLAPERRWQNLPLLDFGDDPRFTPALFRDSIHLNSEGMALFNQLIADELIRLSSGR